MDMSGGDGDSDEDPVPGLPRVIDALSTIMWPSMIRRGGGDSSRASKGQAAAAALTSPFDCDVLHTEEGEEETLAALMEADAAYTGAPQTRVSRMQKEMATLERWLVENEELYEAELGESMVSSSPTDIDEDGGDDDDEDDKLWVPAAHATSGDPWLSHNSSAPPTMRRDGAAPGFDDDFSAFISAPAVSITSTAAASASVPGLTLAASGVHGFLDASSVPMLLPSHTGGSYRSLRSGTSGLPSDVDEDHAGYEALDDRSSFFSPEHEFDDADADLLTPVGRRLEGERVGLTDARAPFDLTDILASLQTMRENVAGIEDEAQRRATTARLASEFVFQRMGVDGSEEGTKG